MNEAQEQMIYDEGFRRGFENGYEACRDDVAEKMAELTAARPRGEWIDTGNDKEHLHPLSARWYRCSVCGLETNAKTNYCFDCGADMRGENDE